MKRRAFKVWLALRAQRQRRGRMTPIEPVRILDSGGNTLKDVNGFILMARGTR